ncbi:MAG: TROVE domain-containing protein [Planctomycetaceae bacterium]|nr:TROVE domain-containing protein [Planctomycetaceae bacterium]
MANKSLFQSLRGVLAPKAEVVNEAGGLAYSRSDKQALAQYAATGCLGDTFYASADEQLDAVLKLCNTAEPEFIARTAIYAREHGHMKDMPALLLAVLSVRSPGLLAEAFDRVIDSPKMLRNFVQIMRSGVVGRKSLGTLPKRLIVQWLEARSDAQLFTGSVGNDPSLADVLRMVHPKPATPAREALYGYLIGRQHNAEVLPDLVKQYEKFKRNTNPGKVAVPDVPFQLLTALPLTKKDWRQIARTASWQMTRMNLNTFLRHEVFQDAEMTTLIANRLRNPRLVEMARVFPYQLMTAYANADTRVPTAVRESLQDAMELALKNVPRVAGKAFICPDVSGSMHSPVTGHRQGATTAVRCIDVAALVAAAVLRQNPDAEVLPFNDQTVNVRLNPRDSVMTNAKKLSSLPPSGTNCSAPLRTLNQRRAMGDLVVFVSDNESWTDTPAFGRFGGGRTATMNEWSAFKTRNPRARMVCIDIQPSGTVQAKERVDIVNVGGFSDQVFELLANVASGQFAGDHWVRVIEAVRL